MASQFANIEIDPSLSKLGTWLEEIIQKEKIVVLADENTQKHCLPLLHSNPEVLNKIHVIVIPPGEEHKDFQSVSTILEELTQQQADRQSILISLGGGVICDIGAFAASIYKRGIRSVLVPTTLLAQVDASIGGKTGIDFMGYKNQVGTFSPPEKIFISSTFLVTLSGEEKQNGIAECLKHGLIADKSYWEEIKQDPFKNTEELIRQSVKIKSTIVEKDPYEQGIRKILNAGHTIGHAIESAFLQKNNPVSHGKAVAAGLIIELFISNQAGYINTNEMNEAISVIDQYFSPLSIASFDPDELLQLMQNDKKNAGGNISFSLIRKIGEASWNDQVSVDHIKSAIQHYIAR